MNSMSDRSPLSQNSLCTCQPNGTCCNSSVARRDVLKLGVALAAGAWIPESACVMAGPFTADDFEKLVPADKKLAPAWVQSLFARGEPEWFSGDELKHIGMAIGGICCGHVYLGGDGRLWHWDVFNQGQRTGSGHYRDPLPVQSPVDQGFTLRVQAGNGTDQTRSFDRDGFADVRFRGTYPIGRVEYSDPECPVSVSLEAFSPFVPLDVDNSSLPLTVLHYTVHNRSQQAVTGTLCGHLANPVLLHTGRPNEAQRVNTIRRVPGATCLHCTAEPKTTRSSDQTRPDILFDDFETDRYENWTVEGTAFGDGPITAARMPAYQGDVGVHGKKLINSHNTRQGEDVRGGDRHTGMMTSKPFAITRRFINFLIGGGSHKGETCLNLLVEGQVVASALGHNQNRLRADSFDVSDRQGQTAQLQIVDHASGGWGNIGIDRIVFSDQPTGPQTPVNERPDFGDMTLAFLDQTDDVVANAQVAVAEAGANAASPELFSSGATTARAAVNHVLKGAVGKSFRLAPGERTTVSFAVAWRFPNFQLPPIGSGHYYAERFASSLEAVAYVVQRRDELCRQTRLWHDTWYDATLPYWLLDRTFVNISTLATSTCLRLANGRFWGWEGVRCCPGTCTHVWHYAQAVGRVFPELERITREHVDYGVAFHEDGHMDYRAEFAKREAIDGQCGTILRVLREHQMSADDGFLRRIWPKVRQSIAFLIQQDGDTNGVLEGNQYNTLDASWYGPISWISSLYVAALRAGTAMAREMDDAAFAEQCDTIAKRGGQQIVELLFNGEYFCQRRDPKHPEAIGAGIGCHIDQVFGQGWAHQVGLPRVLPKEPTVTALKSLWRYNFTPDVGPYRERYTTGRWYAMPGEAGLIMCTFPKGGEREARGSRPTHGFAGYLNECMNGFEYQAAGHMIAEGLVQEGLAVTRAIHDRYHPSRRNPYNEIECGDHYARSMASYGVYASVCGYEYHGPKAHIGFAPKLAPENFRAAFVAAEGWGTFQQTIHKNRHTAELTIRHGRLRLRTVALVTATVTQPQHVRAMHDGQPIDASVTAESGKTIIRFAQQTTLETDGRMVIEID